MRFLITGASGGLGSAINAALIARGDAQTHLMLRSYANQPLSMLTEHTKELVKAVGGEPYSAIIHCAGVEVVAPLRMTSDEQYRSAMMCADSAFALLRAAASKGVMNDGGSIVLMSSVAAHKGPAGMVAYSAGKGAIEAMTRAAAVELAPRRIRVNAIAAGAFRSPMHDRITKRMPAASQEAYAAAHPLGIGSAEDVAKAVLHLLDEPWTTGTVRVVDGGYSA